MSVKSDYQRVEWIPPAVFSIDILVLLAAIFQITKMSYSRTHAVTYLSYYPYYTIIAYITFEAT